MVEGKQVAQSAEGERFGVTGPVTEVEFNIELVRTDKADLQDRHARPRALEDEAVNA